MDLEVLVTHESGACSAAHFTLEDAARGSTHVLARRTRRAVVCWSLTLRSGPCAVLLVRCARPYAYTLVAGGAFARITTRPLKLHLTPTRTRELESILERGARAATTLACGGRLPPDILARIARLVLTAHILHPTRRASSSKGRARPYSPSPSRRYL